MQWQYPKKLFKAKYFILSLTYVLLFLPLLVFSSISKTYTFSELNWTDSNKMAGNLSTLSYFLPLEKNRKYLQAKLHLLITTSPLLQTGSALTIELNNKPVGNFSLASTEPSASGNTRNLDLSLPLEKKPGDWLNIKMIGILHSKNELDVWASISKESTLSLEYQDMNVKPDLSELPYPFITNNPLESPTTLLVLPLNPTKNELNQALQVARALGAQLNYNKIDLKSTSKLTAEEEKNNNLIFVGQINKFSYLNPNINPNPLAKDIGLIQLNQSPWNPLRVVLLITGENDNGVNKAIAAFSNLKANPLKGSSILITKMPVLFSEKQLLDKKAITLQDLGYKDQSVLGLGQKNLSYTFNLPYNKDPKRIIINTVLNHAPFSASDPASLTLFINYLKQDTTALTKSNENNASWQITLPGKVLNPGRNILTYTFDLNFSRSEEERYYFQAWGDIQATTTLQISLKDRKENLQLKQFTKGLDPLTLIVVPTKRSNEENNNLIQFFLKLGSLLGVKDPIFQLATAEKTDEIMLRQYSAIFIGTPTANPWIAKAMAFAPLKIVNTDIRVYDKNISTSDNKKPVGILEYITSPWHKKSKLLIISGSNETAVSSALNILINDNLRNELTGNLATVSLNNQLTNYQDEQETSKSTVVGWGKYLYQHLSFVLTGIFLIVAIVLAMVGFIIRRKQ